jgi:hypothetical protein
MKKSFLYITGVAAIFLGSAGLAQAAGEVCFCHSQPSTPDTICTSDSGQQNGHFGHGDIPMGCECGDGVCSPEFGEDCGTCPTDCGVCSTCGDGVVDPLLVEECGEPDLSCATGQCVGCRCLLTCGNGTVEIGEQCDGGACCNPDCTSSTGSCEDGDVCTQGETCQSGVCTGGSLVDCNDGNECTSDSCDLSGGCQNTPVFCTDGNTCSTDACDPTVGCTGSLTSCDDGDDCTIDTCDPGEGCVHTADTSAPACSPPSPSSSGFGISGCQLIR